MSPAVLLLVRDGNGWRATGELRTGCGLEAGSCRPGVGVASELVTCFGQPLQAVTRQSAVFEVPPRPIRSGRIGHVGGGGSPVEALAVLGWSWPLLQRRLALPRQTLMFRRARPRVRAEYARQVRDLYDELSMRRGLSAHAVGRAAARGWLPPLAWDEEDLDDPRVPPAVLRCAGPDRPAGSPLGRKAGDGPRGC